MTNVQQEVSSLKKKVDDLESSKDVIRGQRDIGKEVLKWLAGIFAAIIIYMATKG